MPVKDSGASLNVGFITLYAGPITNQTAAQLDSRGWVPCDGRTLPRAGKYQTLCTLLNDAFRQPGDDLANTFRVPNLIGRVPVGSSTSPAAGPYQLAQTGGQEKNVVTAADLPHVHHVSGSTGSQNSAWCCIPNRSLPNTDGFDHSHSLGLDSQGVKSATPLTLQNMQPYLVLHYLISYK